jgi:hypothetical protein
MHEFFFYLTILYLCFLNRHSLCTLDLSEYEIEDQWAQHLAHTLMTNTVNKALTNYLPRFDLYIFSKKTLTILDLQCLLNFFLSHRHSPHLTLAKMELDTLGAQHIANALTKNMVLHSLLLVFFIFIFSFCADTHHTRS